MIWFDLFAAEFALALFVYRSGFAKWWGFGWLITILFLRISQIVQVLL